MARMKPGIRNKVRRKRRGDPDLSPLQAWERSVAKMKERIANLKSVPPMMGNQWQAKQIAYFERLLQNLIDNKPK